jgi:hypothetical protein
MNVQPSLRVSWQHRQTVYGSGSSSAPGAPRNVLRDPPRNRHGRSSGPIRRALTVCPQVVGRVVGDSRTDRLTMEREKRFELSTSTLARLHSTTELLPRTASLLSNGGAGVKVVRKDSRGVGSGLAEGAEVAPTGELADLSVGKVVHRGGGRGRSVGAGWARARGGGAGGGRSGGRGGPSGGMERARFARCSGS